MKKIILFSAVACMALFACKKDSKTDTTTPDTDESAAIDPVALSAAVKIGFATSTKGDLPAASAGGPTLYIDGYDNRTYYAINNRYIVIYPQSDKGFVAGYYVKINGADNYFKIAYKATEDARKLVKSHGLREEGDNSDSSILIKLPAGLKGDTFSIKYAAYDTLNRVSNTISAIVSVIASKDTADNNLLAGTWRFNRYKSDRNDWSKPEIYGKLDTSFYNFACVDGKLQYCDEGGCDQYANQIYGVVKNDMTFSANNIFTAVYERLDKRIDQNESTCNNIVYNPDYGYSGKDVGGYTYNATTKVLTFIYDYDGTTNDYVSNLYTDQYTVTEISSTKLIYYYKSQNNNDDGRIGARDQNIHFNYYEFLKQ